MYYFYWTKENKESSRDQYMHNASISFIIAPTGPSNSELTRYAPWQKSMMTQIVHLFTIGKSIMKANWIEIGTSNILNIIFTINQICIYIYNWQKYINLQISYVLIYIHEQDSRISQLNIILKCYITNNNFATNHIYII